MLAWHCAFVCVAVDGAPEVVGSLNSGFGRASARALCSGVAFTFRRRELTNTPLTLSPNHCESPQLIDFLLHYVYYIYCFPPSSGIQGVACWYFDVNVGVNL